MNTWTCRFRYREFDIMLQHQQLIFFYVYSYFIDWNIAFNQMFNLLKSINFDIMSFTHGDRNELQGHVNLNTGTLTKCHIISN